MTKLLNILSAIGALTMAATPLVAIADVAHAATLTSPHAQVAQLHTR